MLRYAAVAALLFTALAARPSFADVAFQASVTDGHNIVVAGEHVRLQGIGYPELHQTSTPTAKSGGVGKLRRSG